MTALPLPPTSRKARSTHDALVTATRDVIRRTGALIPAEVAETAQLSPATFYAYLSSKDTALAAAFDLSLGEMLQRVAEKANVEHLLEEGLETTVRAVVEETAGAFRLDARVFRLAVGRLGESELLRAVYRHRETEALQLLARFVRLGAAAGKIRGEPDPETVARALLVALQGLQNPLLHEEGERDEVVALLSEMLTAMLRPASS